MLEASFFVGKDVESKKHGKKTWVNHGKKKHETKRTNAALTVGSDFFGGEGCFGMFWTWNVQQNTWSLNNF